MVPHESGARVLSFPAAVDRGIVVVTGASLSDQRCAYRLQQDCGSLVRGWLEVGSAGDDPRRTGLAGRWSRWGPLVRRHLALGAGHLGRLAASVPRRIRYRRLLSRRPRELALAEQRLFGVEIDAHCRRAGLQPRRVAEPGGPAMVEAVRGLNPFLLVASNRALVSSHVLEAWRGPVLAMHPGWSPSFPGSSPGEQALFHRDLNGIGATVHLLTSNGELGPIVRRSHPCLLPWDSPEACLTRTLALGTELLCEAVQEIVRHHEIVVYEPPVDRGIPQLTAPLDGRMLAMLRADFAEGWLETALHQARQF